MIKYKAHLLKLVTSPWACDNKCQPEQPPVTVPVSSFPAFPRTTCLTLPSFHFSGLPLGEPGKHQEESKRFQIKDANEFAFSHKPGSSFYSLENAEKLINIMQGRDYTPTYVQQLYNTWSCN